MMMSKLICTRSDTSNIEKHNYIVLNENKIECNRCKKILTNNHDPLEVSFEPFSIYRIHLKKLPNKKGFLSFPGKSYIDITKKKPIDRWNNHLTDAFNKNIKNRKNAIFHRALRKYGITKNLARNNFKLKILQVCSNKEGANKAEKFWIGWFKTQDILYGWNILPGGQTNSTTTEIVISYTELDKAINQSIIIPKANFPINFLAKKFGVCHNTINRKIKKYYRKENGEYMTYWDIRKIYISKLLELYIKQGYPKSQIGPKLGLSGNPQNTISSYIKEFFSEFKTFTDMRYNLIQKVLTSLIGFGYESHKDIAEQLPGMKERTVRSFITKYWNGLKNARCKLFLKPRVVQFIKMGFTGPILCRRLGYSDHFSNQHHEKIISNILK